MTEPATTAPGEAVVPSPDTTNAAGNLSGIYAAEKPKEPAEKPAVEETKTEAPTTEAPKKDALTEEPASEPAEKAEEATKEGDPATDEPSTGAPEEYAEFSRPEGMEIDSSVLGEFAGVAKELDLTQDQAQKLFDIHTSQIERVAEDIAAVVDQHDQANYEALRTDKVLGKPENQALAARAVEQFGGAELKTWLSERKLANEPVLVRAFMNVGQAISEDTLVTGQDQGRAKEKAEQRRYGWLDPAKNPPPTT